MQACIYQFNFNSSSHSHNDCQREITDHFYPPLRCHLSLGWCHYLYFCTQFCTIYTFAENSPAFSCHRFIIFKLQRILFLNCSEIASTFKFFSMLREIPLNPSRGCSSPLWEVETFDKRWKHWNEKLSIITGSDLLFPCRMVWSRSLYLSKV